MKMKNKSILALVVVLVSISTVSATIVNDTAPSWRGDEATTHQAWGFDDDTSPAVLEDGLYNPYGNPTLEVFGVDPPYDPPTNFIPPKTFWESVDNGHEGVWNLFKEDFIQICIPNNPVPNDRKIIWFQMTYYASGYTGSEPDFFIHPNENTLINLVSKTLLGAPEYDPEDYYFHAIWEIIIEPNPDKEWITLQPRDCSIIIDEIIVDTICIPEPMTVALLGLGGLLLCRKK